MTNDVEPTIEEAKEALSTHIEEPDPAAANLPTDVKDGEIPVIDEPDAGNAP